MQAADGGGGGGQHAKKTSWDGSDEMEKVLPIAKLAIRAQGSPLMLAVHENALETASISSGESASQVHGGMVKSRDKGRGTVNRGSDCTSITSEDSSGTSSEHSLPRVIKPRKRRKKEKRLLNHHNNNATGSSLAQHGHHPTSSASLGLLPSPANNTTTTYLPILFNYAPGAYPAHPHGHHSIALLPARSNPSILLPYIRSPAAGPPPPPPLVYEKENKCETANYMTKDLSLQIGCEQRCPPPISSPNEPAVGGGGECGQKERTLSSSTTLAQNDHHDQQEHHQHQHPSSSSAFLTPPSSPGRSGDHCWDVSTRIVNTEYGSRDLEISFLPPSPPKDKRVKGEETSPLLEQCEL